MKMTMTHGSLFSGIGGFDLAAEWAGWKNLFNCEIDPFCQRILKYHFPNAEQYSDIKQTDFTIWRGRVDVLSGGFPCQPFSTAGKRKGTEDSRYLWPEMLRAIREISPRWIVGENVLGIVSWSGGLVFEQVCADLEAEGYEVQPYVLPAAGVGAPHQRQRVWFVAHATIDRDSGRPYQIRQTDGRPIGELLSEPIHSNNIRRIAKNTQCIRCAGEQSEKESCAGGFGEPCAGDNVRVCGKKEGATTDTQCVRRGKICQNIQSEQPNGKRTNSTCCEWDVANSESLLLQGYENRQRQVKSRRSDNEQIFNWQNFPTQSPVCDRDDGISLGLSGITFSRWRQESIKALGNSMVAPLVYEIFLAIEQVEQIK